MAVLFQHTLPEPVSDIPFDLDLLKRMVDLAEDPDYRKARQALYDWQEDRVVKGYAAEQAKEEMKVNKVTGLDSSFASASHIDVRRF